MSRESVDLDGMVLLKSRYRHVDLVWLKKFGVNDFRDILERALARETATIGDCCGCLGKFAFKSI